MTRLSRRAAMLGAAMTAVSTAACSTSGAAPHSGPPRGDASTPAGDSSATTGPGPLPAATPAEIASGSRDRPQVALTFHGQGDEAIVRRLLDALAAGGARVTVFAVGTWLRELPAMAGRILDGGHELGNHTMHHLNIATMDGPQAFAEIDGCAQELRKLT